jgi:hypothetical protein
MSGDLKTCRVQAPPSRAAVDNFDLALGICPKCRVSADGYLRGRKGVWALCQHCRCRWRTDYCLPSWIPDQPEGPAPFQRNWTSERIWAFREKMIAEYRTAEQIAADDMIMATAEEAEGS